jgi:uncharacterized protein
MQGPDRTGMTDDLSAPLGRKRRKRNAPGHALDWSQWPWARIGTAALFLLAIAIVAWIALVDDPTGGRPVAEAPVTMTTVPNQVAIEVGREIDPQTVDPGAIDIPATGAGPSFITLGDNVAAIEQNIELVSEYGVLPQLIEETQLGPLPRVGADGLKPHEAYARPAISLEAAGGRKLIAVVVTGLGLNRTTTSEAINTLPGAVTLAFAPYGDNLSETARAARSAGHEIMIELPLEPFDYPQNDPGPHTLLADQPPRDNLEKLYWLLARMGGYTGVLNHMGARFTASAADFSPVMEELGLRGLAYLDDGTSNRSVAPQLARGNNVPFARADRALDTNPSRGAILEALTALENQAGDRGWAIGTLSALPVSIRTLADWSKGLDEDTYLLVPVSALLTDRLAGAQ